MKKIAVWFLVLLAAVPLVSVSYTMVPTLNGKVLVYRAIVFLVCAAVLWGMLREKVWREEIVHNWQKLCRNPLFVAMTGGAVLLLISTLFAYNSSVAFFGEPTRGEGFLTLFSLYILYVFLSLLFQRKEWNRFFIISGISAIVLFIYEVYQITQGLGRPSSFIGNPIFLSACYLFSLFTAHYLFVARVESKKRLAPVLGVVVGIVSGIGMILTETRGTLLGMAVASIVCLIIAALYGKGRYIRGIPLQKVSVIAIVLIFLGISGFWLTRTAPVWQTIPGVNRIAQSNRSTIESRFIYLKITGKGFLESTTKQKLIGWGWDNYRFFWDKYYDPTIYFFDRAPADRPHNKLADHLIMTGVLGLFAYLLLWGVFIKHALKLHRIGTPWAMGLLFVAISYFVHNLFVFDTPVIFMSFYALLAFTTYHSYEKK